MPAGTERIRPDLQTLLQEKAFDRLMDHVRHDPAGVRKLFGRLYDADSLVRWRAVMAFGLLAAAMPAKIRRITSRLAYALNDEATICAWSTAPAVAEITHHNPALTREVVRIVVHYCEDTEACQSANRNPVVLCSALWAVGRVGRKQPELAMEVWPTLAAYTGDPLPEVRGHAFWAMAHARFNTRSDLRQAVSRLAAAGSRDQAGVAVFDPETGDMPWQTVGDWARACLVP